MTESSRGNKVESLSQNIGDIFYVQSPPHRLISATILAVLLWMALRLWWSLQPMWLLPLAIGILLPALLRKSDLPIVSLVVSMIAVFLFPLKGMPAGLVLIVSTVVMAAISLLVSSFANESWRSHLPYLVLAIILLGFFSHGLIQQRAISDGGYRFVDVLNYNPPAETYRFDGFIYTKTFYLMEEGKDYYGALQQAILDDARLEAVPTSVMGWRLPTIFYSWHLLFSRGEQIGLAFLYLAVLVALIAYFLAKELSNASFAVLPAAFICGYFFFGVNSLWLVFVEYWGLIFVFAAAFFFIRGQTVAAAALAALAPIVRELYIFGLVAGFLSELISKNIRRALVWVVAGLVFIALYGLHYSRVKGMIPALDASASWILGGSWQFILDAMTFSTDNLVESASAAVIIYGLGLIGFLFVSPSRNRLFLVLLAIMPPIVFRFIGAEWSYYWGVSFMPFTFVGLAPGLMALEKFSMSSFKYRSHK